METIQDKAMLELFTDIDDEAAVRDVCLRHFYDSLIGFEVLPEVSVTISDEVTQVITPDVPNWLTNAVFNCNIDEVEIQHVITEAIQRYARANVAPFWRVCAADQPANLDQLLMANGFALRDTQILMSMKLSQLTASDELNASTSIHKITSADEMRQDHPSFSRVKPGMGKSFAALMLDIFDHHGYGVDSVWHHYVAFHDTRPIGYASMLYSCGVAGIYNVGVLPDARRQGVGTALTHRALSDARRANYQLGTLQSSQMGLGMYQGLGFVIHDEIRYFAPTVS